MVGFVYKVAVTQGIIGAAITWPFYKDPESVKVRLTLKKRSFSQKF